MAKQTISAASGTSLVATVMDSIQQRINSRSLLAGAKLPSIRGLAESLTVSKSTVVEAYDRLLSSGVIHARRGSGFYVAGHAPPLSIADLGPRLDRAIDPIWVMRQSLETSGTALRPGCGWLPRSWLPEAALRTNLRRLARHDKSQLTGYGVPPAGFMPMRQYLAARMADRGSVVAPEQIMLTDSGTHAIDLVMRFFIKPGDVVLVDDPCYFNFTAMLRAHRAEVVGVPYTAHGPDLECFAKALAAHKPRLYVTNSAFHNPSGAVIKASVVHRILKLAEQHDLLIIEDDIYADFEREAAPRFATLDALQRVVQIGSFSKTVSAAVRCGYIAARPDWIEQLIDLKLATTFGNSPFAAELLHGVISNMAYRRHLRGMHERLANATGETLRRLKHAGFVIKSDPVGGLFVWAQLPGKLLAADIAQRALTHNVVLAPGNVFSVSQACNGMLRFNVSQSPTPRVFEVLQTVMEGSASGRVSKRA
jgi:DNA-binding transcriptional MocR family regulator